MNAQEERVVPMRIQARKGSVAEQRSYGKSGLPGAPWPMPKAIAPGVSPAPLEDLLFHGGKLVPQMQFQNVYLGAVSDWPGGDMESIDGAITLAMRDQRLNNVMVQYFHGAKLSCDPIASVVTGGAEPKTLDEPDVQAKIVRLFDAGTIGASDLGTTIFNLILPPGSILALNGLTSLEGLGGYHGSAHVERGGRDITLYYSASVYSEALANGRVNGIPAFNERWKNVVATLYHELNEFRTDADVRDAIEHRDNDFLGWASRRGREVGDEPIAAARSLDLVFQEVIAGASNRKIPVQFMYSNVVHGPEGPIESHR